MRLYNPPAPPAPVVRKTNITRGSSIRAITELKRLIASSITPDSFEAGTYLVSGKDLVVFDRLIDFAYNLPDEIGDGFPLSLGRDGDGANSTAV